MRRFRIRSDLVIASVFLVVLGIPSYEAVNDKAYCDLPDWPYETRRTESGLDVHVTGEGIQCWGIPLPCTPYFRPSLSSRVDGDLSRGFYLEKTPTLADHTEGTIPLGFELSPDLGIHLVSGWRRLDLTENRRVMARAGRFFVYTESPISARLRLRSLAIDSEGEPLENTRLTVRLAGIVVYQGQLQAGEAIDVELALKRDFNDLILEVEPEVRGEVDGLRAPRVAVTFESIAITSKSTLESPP